MHMSMVHAWNADCTNGVRGDGGSVAKRAGTRCVVELTLRVYPFRHSNLNTRTQNRALSLQSHSLVLIVFRDGPHQLVHRFQNHCASDFVIPRDVSWNYEELLTILAEIQ